MNLVGFIIRTCRVFGNRVVRKIFGHMEELRAFFIN